MHTVLIQIDINEHGINLDALLDYIKSLQNVIDAKDINFFKPV